MLNSSGIFSGTLAILLLATLPLKASESDARLVAAVERGDKAGARQALKEGADVNASSSVGLSVLAMAAQRDDMDLVNELLGRGSLVAGDFDVLEAVLPLGSLKTLQRLIDAGAPLDRPGNAILPAAVNTGSFEKVLLLLKHGAEVNGRDRDGVTALMLAAAKRLPKLARLLLSHGADLNAAKPAAQKGPWNALCFAVGANSPSTVRMLLAHGADPHWNNDQPFRVAEAAGLPGMVEFLKNPSLRQDDSWFPTPPPENSPFRWSKEVPPLKVFVADFTTNDPSHRSSEKAKDFSALLKTHLANVEGILVVERSASAESELQISALGDAAGALQLGKWLGAEVVVCGRFAADEGAGSKLTIEAVDLSHADILAQRRQLIPMPAEERFAFAEKNVQQAAATTADLLLESAQKRTKDRDIIRIAPLFFQNVSNTGHRLDFLEDDFLVALARSPGGNQVISRFPRSDLAAGESALIVAGLVESDPEAWNRVAHYFVWGDYEEINAKDTAFENIRVRLRLFVWDGATPPQKVETELVVGQMAGELPRIARRILDMATRRPAVLPSDSVRDVVAASLQERARVLQGQGGGIQEALQRTDGWLRRWRLSVSLLELAHFLAPSNGGIERDLLVERWNHNAIFPSVGNDRFWTPEKFASLWRQCEDWGRHVDKHDFAYLDALPEDSNIQAKLPQSTFTYPTSRSKYSVQNRYVNLPRQMIDTLYKHERRVPDELPAHMHREWNEKFLVELARRLVFVADRRPDQCTLRVLDFTEQFERTPDAVLRARAYEAIWEIAGGQNVPPEDIASFQPLLAKAFHDAGRGGEVAALFSGRVGLPSSAPSPELIVSKASSPSFENEPSHQDAFVEGSPLTLPDSPFQPSIITRILFSQGRLFIMGSGGAQSAVWVGEGDSRKFSALPALALFSKQAFTDFAFSGDSLWLSTDGQGAWQYTLSDAALKKFGARDGVPTEHLFRCAVGAKEIFFGGGADKEGALGAFHRDNNQWSGLAFENGSSNRTARVSGLAASGNHLLVAGKSLFRPASLSVFDTEARTWKGFSAATEKMLQLPPGRLLKLHNVAAVSCVGDESGFWIGGGSTLLFLDPATGREEFLSDHSRPIEGQVSCLADDADYLWVGGVEIRLADETSRPPKLHSTPRVFVVSKSQRKVLGSVRLRGDSFVSAITTSKANVWIAVNGSPVLLEVSKEKILKLVEAAR